MPVRTKGRARDHQLSRAFCYSATSHNDADTDAISNSFLNANQFLAEMRVHLIEISTGEYHSAASQPIIELPHMPFLPGNCSVSIEIVGDTLGILFNLSRLLHGLGAGPAIKFFLYNWKTGKLRFVSVIRVFHRRMLSILIIDQDYG